MTDLAYRPLLYKQNPQVVGMPADFVFLGKSVIVSDYLCSREFIFLQSRLSRISINPKKDTIIDTLFTFIYYLCHDNMADMLPCHNLNREIF